MLSLALDFLLTDSCNAIDSVLHGYVLSSQLLLAELFSRLIRISRLFGAKLQSYPTLAALQINIVLCYANSRSSNPKIVDAVKKIRSNLFSLFAQLFNRKEVV
jgi:uncharacterized membrane protein YoaT (DUF817 family)